MGPKLISPFKVLIVGAGVGGLFMGVCLERAGIDFVILERMTQLPPPRNNIQLSANTLRAIGQLGLLDEVMKIAKPVSAITLRKHNMSVVGKMEVKYVKERYGYYSCIVQRIEFLQILMSRIPSHKIQWGRYVLDIVNGNAGVQCRCANGVVEQADILVGADGAYSAVRQNLYRSLREKNLLPKPDMEPLKYTQNAIVGLTKPMDVERYPAVGARFSEVNVVVGKDAPYTLWLSPSPGNRVAWSVVGELLTPEGSDNANFKQSEFGPEAIDAACELVQDLEIPWGGTMADIIASTERDFITKVMVEEKHYKTWHHGRTVLVGEACHKFVPFSGQGADQAIMDVICLVNLLYRVAETPTHKDFCAAFESYRLQRSSIAKDAVDVSNTMSHLMIAQGLSADLKRKILFNLPGWVTTASVDKIQVRPLLDFLPPVEDRGKKKSVKIPATPPLPGTV
ncbi:hypothetical protein BGZ98_005540 [Dissophora globulifera]|uniref:FAD-binding domain-containing protein n=1 Tax=Dissophora globulifera TaxID=979702 RepID=A0A9P6RDU7_9FUNG|nr:hypothetical protein BGZ98_005540 [Dissophora globulifera]KAG0315705.1 hypothetical protein BGZ99_007311 [Dissophora globulifera]